MVSGLISSIPDQVQGSFRVNPAVLTGHYLIYNKGINKLQRKLMEKGLKKYDGEMKG